MKFTSNLRSSFMYIKLFVVCSIATDERFVVVSDYEVARDTYAPVRESGGSSCFYDLLDRHAKARICKDLTSTHLFRKSQLLRCGFNPSQWFRVSSLINKPTQEFVFACVVRKDEQTLRYYVSENQYYVDGVATRFIFKKSRFEKEIDLYGLVEAAAKTVSNINYSVEQIYLERRKYCGMMCRPRPEDDPLCRLEKTEQARICIAVFNSKYFESPKFTFPTDIVHIYGGCNKRKVSFQTEQGRLGLGQRTLMEWTLSCKVRKNDDTLQYLISQAYQSNEIFVYFRDSNENVFLENLSTNVQFFVDYNEFHRPAYVV